LCAKQEWLFAWLVFLLFSGAALADVTELSVGKVREGTLSAGNAQSYVVSLNAWDYARINVEPRGKEIVVIAYDPSGRKFRGARIGPGESRFDFVVERSGMHRIEIAASDKTAEGNYSITLEKIVPFAARLAPPKQVLESPRIKLLKASVQAGNRQSVDACWEEVRREGAPIIEPLLGDRKNKLVTFLWRATPDTQNVIVLRIPNAAGAPDNYFMSRLGEFAASNSSGEARVAFDRQVMAKLAALPGVESITLADFSPLSFSIHSEYFQLEGYVPQAHESMEISDGLVGPKYFETLRTQLISGRDFTEQDGADSQRVAIVNQELVDRYWPGQNAIGKRLSDGEWFTVVGVAQNAKYRLLTDAPEPVVYLPLYQTYRATQETTIHLRVQGDPKAFGHSVEGVVHELNPELPVFNVNPLKVTMKFGTILEHVAAVFAGSFGVHDAAAHTRDWDSHGIGSAERADLPDGVEASVRVDTGWTISWHSGFPDDYAIPAKPVVRGERHRRVDIRRGRNVALGGITAGMSYSCASGHKDRTEYRAAM
jgi:MacB-like periplasmic core domain